MWTPKQIKAHEEAARRLGLIKDEVIDLLRKSKSMHENDVLIFIRKCYRKHGLVNDDKKIQAIAAFGVNTSNVHYFLKGKGSKLKPNTLILLDMWARLDKKDAPYADMTWMFYKVASRKSKVESGIPKKIQKEWRVLKKSRDTAINYISRKELPRGLDIDRAAHDVLGNAGYGEYIKHTVGHSLGFKHPHGKLPGINWREYRRLSKKVGYTIEPGMYMKDYGMRTEIDFYISKSGKIVITTPVQKELDLL